MKKILSLALSLMAVSSVSFAQEAGFQFVLVATHQGTDVVFMNEDVPNRDFALGEMNCKTRLETKKDPVYPEQMLGSLILECTHEDFPIQTSVSCSLLDPAAQTHFEFGKADAKFSFDLLCKAKVR